jgi:hypothetical protein
MASPELQRQGIEYFWTGLRIESIDPRRQFWLRQMTFVVAEDAVARIREPDGAVRRNHHVVGGVEL